MGKQWLWIATPVVIGIVLLGILFFVNESTTSREPPVKELQIIDVKEGTGPAARRGDTVVVHYTGTLRNGTKFDSSRDRDEPFEFALGRGQVIEGWDQGVAGMKVGGIRKLVIPPQLGYRDKDMGNIPPNSQLHFEVELLGIK